MFIRLVYVENNKKVKGKFAILQKELNFEGLDVKHTLTSLYLGIIEFSLSSTFLSYFLRSNVE
jgi:hypothetical protein